MYWKTVYHSFIINRLKELTVYKNVSIVSIANCHTMWAINGFNIWDLLPFVVNIFFFASDASRFIAASRRNFSSNREIIDMLVIVCV